MGRTGGRGIWVRGGAAYQCFVCSPYAHLSACPDVSCCQYCVDIYTHRHSHNGSRRAVSSQQSTAANPTTSCPQPPTTITASSARATRMGVPAWSGSKALLLAYWNRPLPETFLLISLSREYRANLSTLSRLFCKRKNATGTFTVETGTLRRRSTACEHAGSTPAVVCFSN